MPVQRPLGPQYGTSSEQIAQMAAMISSARSEGGRRREVPGAAGDMTEYMRGELEAQRSSRVGTAIQKATLLPGAAFSTAARVPDLDKLIEKAVAKISKVRGAPGAGGAAAGGIDPAALTEGIQKVGGLGYLGTSGILNVPRQKQLAYEQQYRKQLGGVGTASSALSSISMANRALAMPRVASMVYGGGMPASLQQATGLLGAGRPMAEGVAKKAGVSLPASMMDPSSMAGIATGAAPLIAAQMGLSMMKARKMKKITAQRKSGGAEEAKFSLSSQLEAQINQLASTGALQPGDQLQIQLLRWVESHTSVLPELWAEQKYIREEKEKGGAAASGAFGKAMGEKSDEGVFSSIASSAEKFTSTRLAKYDIFGQLFNFLSTGKLPKQFQEELEMAYGTGESFKEAKERSKERGIGIAQTRLLEMTGRQVVDMAPNYETKMLTVLSASFDVHRYIGSELLTIRKQGFGIPDAAIKSEDYESSALGKVWNLLRSPGEMLTNIPGFNAIWNIIKMPFGIGNTVREGAKGIWGGVRKFMMGGQDTMDLLENDEELRKKAGIFKSKQDMANDFMGRGLPNVMEETRALGWRQLTELINIYGVLSQIYQAAVGGRAVPFRQEPFSSQAKIGIWSPSAGKFVDEKGLADQQKQDKDRMQIALEDAFKGSGMDRIGWLLQKFTGEGTVEERLAGAAGRVRGIEAAPYGWAEQGQERGGLMGLMQMIGASPFIDVAEGLTLTPEEQITSALYSQRAVKGRGRAAMAPGWFGKEQARRQMGLERDLFPQFQRGGARGAGGLVGGLGMAGLGGAASLLSGGALLPLMMGMGVGGMAGAVPQNIMEFMQTKRVFEGISGEDIARVTAGYATMPKLDSKTRERVITYYKDNFPKEYNQLGVGSDEFFEDITNLPYIQLAMSSGTPIGEMLTDFDKAMGSGLVDYKGGTGVAATGGMFGLFDGMQKGTVAPLPVQIADVSEEMIFKFPGLFQVSEEWKKIQAIAKDKDDDERKREEEKARLRKEAQEMKKLSAADRQKLIDSKTIDKQALLEEQWEEYVSPRVKRLRPGSRASQRKIEKEWSEHEKAMGDDTELEKPHRGVIGKIVDFMEYRKSKKPKDPGKWGSWLEEIAGERKMAAAEGGVVGQTGLAYVHEGEVIGGPQLLWKMMTGTQEQALGAAGAFGRGMKGELSELKQKLKETRMFKIFETMRDKLVEIDENTEGVDKEGRGAKSGKKKKGGGLNFSLSGMMGMLPMLVPAVLAILGSMIGGGAGGSTGAIIGGGLGIGAGLWGSGKALGLAKTGVKKAGGWAVKKGLPMAGRALGGLGRGVATGARALGAAGLTALAGIGGTAAGAYRAQEKYGDPLGEELSAWQKLGLGAGTGLKWATLGAIDVDKMTGTSHVIEQVKKSKEQTKKTQSKTTARLEGNTSPDAKKLYIYDKEGNITNFMTLRYKKIFPSIGNRYGWVTKEEADAEQEVKTEIKKTTGKDVKKLTGINNRLHIEAIRRYEYYKEDKNEPGIAQSTREMSVWSDLPPDTQLKMLQQQEGRLKVEAGDTPKAPPKTPPKTTAQAMSIDNEARRLSDKKKVEAERLKEAAIEDKKREDELKAKTGGRYTKDLAGLGVDTASAGKVIEPGTGGYYGGMAGVTEESKPKKQRSSMWYSMQRRKKKLRERSEQLRKAGRTSGTFIGGKLMPEGFSTEGMSLDEKTRLASKNADEMKRLEGEASGLPVPTPPKFADDADEMTGRGSRGGSVATPAKRKSSTIQEKLRQTAKLIGAEHVKVKNGDLVAVKMPGEPWRKRTEEEWFDTQSIWSPEYYKGITSHSYMEKTRKRLTERKEKAGMETVAGATGAAKVTGFPGTPGAAIPKIIGEEDYSHMMKEEGAAKKGGFWGKVKSFFGFGGKKAESDIGVEKTTLKKGGYISSGVSGKKGMVWPGSGVVTSPFGPRKTKLKQASRMHHGVDTRAIGETDDVKSVYKGVVIASGPKWGSLVVQHGTGADAFTTHYIHLADKFVKPGDEVDTGEIIGKAGSVAPYSGMTKHLHFGFKQKDKWYDPELVFKKVDPSFNPSYAKDIVPGRQLSAKLGGTEIDLSTLKEEGTEAAGPFGERYNPSEIRGDLAQRVKQSQAAKKQLDSDVVEQAKGKGADTAPMVIPIATGGSSDRLNDEKDFTTTDSTLDGFLNGLLRDSAYEFNNRYKNYAYQSNVGHMFT